MNLSLRATFALLSVNSAKQSHGRDCFVVPPRNDNVLFAFTIIMKEAHPGLVWAWELSENSREAIVYDQVVFQVQE